MTTFFPVIELVDRYVIAQLKFAKTALNKEELDFYQAQLSKFNLELITTELNQLYDIHNQIWALESDLKSGLEHKHDLAEIGRRAITIRNLNNQRIKIKNSTAEKLGCTVREFKSDHISQ